LFNRLLKKSYGYITPAFGVMFLFLCLIVFLQACKSGDSKSAADERVIARVYDQVLYAADLKNLVPPGSTPADSLALVRQFVQNWTRQQAVLHKAEENLQDEMEDVEARLEEYRNSLITYAYESELIRQKLDTTVSESEIKTFYEANPGNFMLKNNIVQVNYFKLPNNAPKLQKVRTLYRSSQARDLKSLEEYCYQFATEYYFNDEEWLLFEDLVKKVPLQTYNQEQFLRNNRFIEIPDSAGIYFVNIKGFKIKESPSPLTFEQDNIRNLILNKRKLELISAMENDAYQDALRLQEIETWLPKP
jgi:hypothetical protein